MVGGFVLDKKRKGLKPRYIVFISATLILIAAYAVYLLIAGSSYSVPMLSAGTIDTSSFEIEMSADGIVEVEKINEPQKLSGDLENVFIDLRSVKSGDVTLTIKYVEDLSAIDDEFKILKGMSDGDYLNEQEREIELSVLPFGFIYDRTNDSFNGLWMIWLLISAITIVLIVTLILSLNEKGRNGDFSYSMVALCGLIIFLTLSVLLTSVFILIFDHEYLNFMSTRGLAELLFDSGKVFIIITIFPLLIFAFLLSLSNIVLVKREGFTPRNLLGFLLGLALIAGMVLLFILGKSADTENTLQHYLSKVLNTALSYILCYFECMLIATAFCAFLSKRFKVKNPIDYIIILGCSIRSDGTPTPLLRARIDRAISFDNEQSEKYDRRAKFVPSGGQGSDEVISEAECMKRYLVENDIPESRIIKEDKSVNTYQNLAFSKKIIEEDSGDIDSVNAAFSTTNYHIFRSYTLAKKLKFKVSGLSAKTKYYFFPNAFLREFIGLLWEKKHVHLIFVGAISLFFAVIYLLIKY